jgi:hypothetical protein
VSPVLSAQQTEPAGAPVPAEPATPPTDTRVAQVPAAFAEQGTLLFRHFGVGTYESPLGFGGRFAVSIAPRLILRAGASYFSYSSTQTASGIPFQINVRFQSEQAVFDWYPFRGNFHISPGVLFGSSNRAFGGGDVPAGQSFSLNGVTYFSGSAAPIKASGSVYFAHTAPLLTAGWGNWVRLPEGPGSRRHLTFPFEFGVAFVGDPETALNFSGDVCTGGSQRNCQNIATDPSVQANIQVERKRLQNDANWLRFYPILAGGIVYRF